jgi:hypothetical protein
MSNMTAEYQLSGFAGLLQHGWFRPKFAHDQDESYHELDAQVRSGDYFVMIATALDALSRESADYETKIQLEALVSDLIYLQDNYTITKNERER